MVLFPRIGEKYWMVADYREVFFPIEVTVIRKGGLFRYTNGPKGLFLMEHVLVPPGTKYCEQGITEDYDAVRSELFYTMRGAEKAAERLNRRNEHE